MARPPSRLQLPLFFGGNVLFGGGLFFHAFLYNFYLDGLGHDESTMGVAAAALTAGGLAALLPAGRVVDRVGVRTALSVAALMGWSGLSLGAIVSQQLPIYGAAFLAGAGAATWRVAMGPAIMLLASDEWRSRAFSWNVALLVGTGAAWMVGAGAFEAWLEATRGLSPLIANRIALLVGAGATGAALACYLAGGSPVRIPATELRSPDAGSERARVFRLGDVPGLPRSLLTVTLWMLAPALVIPFFNIYFERQHGLTVDRIGLIFGIAHGVTGLVILGSGELATRFGPRRMLAVWTLLFAPVLWSLAWTGHAALAVGLYFVQGIVSPASNPLIDEILLRNSPRDLRGAVSSWRNAATEAAGIVGAVLGGALLDVSSFRDLFLLSGTVGAVGAILLMIALRRLRSTGLE